MTPEEIRQVSTAGPKAVTALVTRLLDILAGHQEARQRQVDAVKARPLHASHDLVGNHRPEDRESLEAAVSLYRC